MKNKIKLPNELDAEQRRLRTLDVLLARVETKKDLPIIRTLINDSKEKKYNVEFYIRAYDFYRENLK